MRKIKKMTGDEVLFNNYNLTSLMLLKKNGRKIKCNESYALHILLYEKLEEYGLLLMGQTESNGLMFRGVMMSDDFPIENEPILKQMHGYSDFTAHILLKGFDDFSVSFDYNVDNGICELQRHCFGKITHRIKFISLSEMLDYLKKHGYDNFS